MLSAGASTVWMTGPVVTSFIIEDKTATRAFDLHPNGKTLHPLYECRFYLALSEAECSVMLENAWISSTLEAFDARRGVHLLADGRDAPVVKAVNWAGELSETFRRHPFTGRPVAYHAVGGRRAGAILIDHNLSYLGSTRLVPNFAPLTLNAAPAGHGTDGVVVPDDVSKDQRTFSGSSDR
jgi:hypothetical protein